MFAIDTRTGSYPHAYLLNKGIELFNQGYDAEEIVKQIEEMKTSKISKIVVIHADDEANARTLLNGHGITYKDLSVDYLVYAEAADGLSAGTIDAAFLTNGLPNASVMELSETLDICLVSISPENAEGIISSNFKKRRKTPFFYSGKMVFLSFVPSSLPLFHFLTQGIIF